MSWLGDKPGFDHREQPFSTRLPQPTLAMAAVELAAVAMAALELAAVELAAVELAAVELAAVPNSDRDRPGT
jgi:hypothetical protein